MKKTILQIRKNYRMILLIIFFITAGCDTTHKAMDIVSRPDFIVDDNFLLKNPIWAVNAGKVDPPGPFLTDFCPCGSGDAADWTSAANCTDQNVEYNKPFWLNVCPNGGHMNYFPITYEATVCWDEYGSGDQDYNFRLHRKDHALETAARSGEFVGFMQTEFDSQETVDDWDGTDTWWEKFRHDKVDEGDDVARDELNGKFVIVIGEAGIDLEHKCHIELHPVYAMFVHIKDDPNDDRWAFFVRNWGDQGYCGNNQIYYRNFLFGDNIIRIKIPHEGAKTSTFTSNIKGISDANHKLSIDRDDVPDGLLLTFHFDVPEEHTTIVGDINIHWINPEKTLQPRGDADFSFCGTGVSSQPLSASENSEMEMKMSRLDSVSKQELVRRLNEQFRIRTNGKPDSIIIKKGHGDIEHLSRRKIKKIDYSKMTYLVNDSVAYKRKNERISFINEFLKSKGIN